MSLELLSAVRAGDLGQKDLGHLDLLRPKTISTSSSESPDENRRLLLSMQAPLFVQSG